MAEGFTLTNQDRERVEEFRSRHKTGVLTLVFTDMVGSTGMKDQLGDATGTAIIHAQQEVVRDLLAEFPEAEEISTAGDSFFLTFIRPSDAVRFCLTLTARLRVASEESTQPILLRIGMHMGEVFIEQEEHAGGSHGKDILGIQVDTAARVMSLAGGGQVLMTRGVFDNSRAILRGVDLGGVQVLSWMNHGPYRVKGVDEPIEICEVGEEGLASLSAPEDSEKAHRLVSADEDPVLGWRPALDLEIPTSAGWVLTEKLGEGGFGEVWRARHKTLKQTRVFKFCFRADRVRSLKREVTLFRVLREQVGEHPNIVAIHDVYFDEPPYYVGMEDVPGLNLVDWCAAHGGAENVPEGVKLHIAAQVGDALQAAHDAGVLHRDIKPSNVLIVGDMEDTGNANGIRVKLSDFGIGQVMSEDVLADMTAAGFTMTMMTPDTGSYSGTRLYMAPELLVGRPASIRSDIYSLGVLLYQLLCGDLRKPLAPDWHDDVPDPVLVEDLGHCFAGDPAKRFAGAALFSEHLRSVPERRRQRAEQVRASEVAARQRRLAIGTAVVAVLALLITMALGYGLRREATQRRAAVKAREEATRERDKAVAARKEAVAAKENADFERYRVTIALAWESLHAGNIRGARELLNSCPAEHRQWEWGYLSRQCREIEESTFHASRYPALSVSRDGRLLAAAGNEDAVRVWNLDSGKQVAEISITLQGLKTPAFAGRADGLAVMIEDPTDRLQFHELHSETPRWEHACGAYHKCLPWLDVSPDGSLIAAASADKDSTVWLWDTESGKHVARIGPAASGASDVTARFAPDGRSILVGCGKRLSRHGILDGTEFWSFEFDCARRGMIALSPDLTWCARWNGHTLEIWNLQDRVLAWSSVIKSSSFRRHLLFTNDGRHLVLGSQEGQFMVFDVLNQLVLCEQSTPGIWGLVQTPSSEELFVGFLSGEVRRISMACLLEGRMTGQQVHCDSKWLSIDLSPEGTHFVTTDGIVEIGRTRLVVETDRRKARIQYPHRGVAWTSSGEYLAAGGREGVVRVFEAATLTVMHELCQPIRYEHYGAPVCFLRDGALLVSGGTDVRVWDFETGRKLRKLPTELRAVTALAVLRESQTLIIAGDQSPTGLPLECWDTRSWTRTSLRCHSPALQRVTRIDRMEVSEDGRLLALAAWDRAVLINVQTGECREFPGLQPRVREITISPDCKRFVTADGDVRIQVWSVDTGVSLLTVEDHTDPVYGLAFTNGGKRLLTSSAHGTIIIRDADPWE